MALHRARIRLFRGVGYATGDAAILHRFQSGDPLAMASFWEAWRAPDGSITRTFCIITTGPNEVMAPIHDRTPVLLHPTDFARWLSPEVAGADVAELVKPYPATEMQAWPVSKAVNRSSSAGEELIAHALITVDR